jgi:Ca-activated chloride channel family protein
VNFSTEQLLKIQFLHPWVFVLAIPLIAFAWWLGRSGDAESILFPATRSLRGLATPLRADAGRWRWLWILPAGLCLLVAMARPRLPKGDVPDPAKGIDIVLTVDFSSSMRQRDFHVRGRRVTRKEALCDVVDRFIDKRKSDRLGIIAFASVPYLVSPLTLDHEWVKAALKQVESSHGSAIGDAIVASTSFLKKKEPDRGKVMIVVTDGENSAGPHPIEIVSLPRREQVRIYTVFIRGDSLRGSDFTGHELTRVSKTTGGQAFQATDTHALEAVYNRIDALEKKEWVHKKFETFEELFPWPAAAGLILAFGVMARERAERRIP